MKRIYIRTGLLHKRLCHFSCVKLYTTLKIHSHLCGSQQNKQCTCEITPNTHALSNYTCESVYFECICHIFFWWDDRMKRVVWMNIGSFNPTVLYHSVHKQWINSYPCDDQYLWAIISNNNCTGGWMPAKLRKQPWPNVLIFISQLKSMYEYERLAKPFCLTILNFFDFSIHWNLHNFAFGRVMVYNI